MIGYEVSRDGLVTVRFADKVLGFRRDELPVGWESLFRDAEVARSVNEAILEIGAPAAEGACACPIAGWEVVQRRLNRLQGTTG